MILTYKPVGMTPLELIQSIKEENAKLINAKMAYAGRLDPMAEGLMLLLIDDECKSRDHFQNLAKTYEFEVLFGASTDSYDILGIVNKNSISIPKNLSSKVTEYIKDLVGTHNQPYPPYSAKTVNGKKLFDWAKEKKLHLIKIPSKKIEIHSIELISKKLLGVPVLQKYISTNIKKVTGDFRQEEILSNWELFFKNNTLKEFLVYKFKVKCGSGTYVRSIANDMGKSMKINSLALSIKRTQVGPYFLSKNKVTTEVIV